MTFPSSMRRGPSDDWGRPTSTDEQEDLDSLGFQVEKEVAEKDKAEDEEDENGEKIEKVIVAEPSEDDDIDGLAELERLAVKTREEEDKIIIDVEEEI